MPSLPTSLIIVCLVVAWLVVLVPMVAKRREEVPEAEDDSGSMRVLEPRSRSGRRRAVLSRTAMAHRTRGAELPDESAIDSSDDSVADSGVADAELTASVGGEVTVDDEPIGPDEAPVRGAVDSFEAEDAPSGTGAHHDLDGAAVRRSTEPVHAGVPQGSTGRDYQRMAPAAERNWERDSSPEAGADEAAHAGRRGTPEYSSEDSEYRSAPVRAGRGGFNPAASDRARAYRFRQRRRVALALLLIALTGAVAGWLGAGFGYPAAVVGGVLLVLYFAYLRRQVRIEAEIRQRRLARLDRARQIRPAYRPSVAEQVYAHRTGEIPRPGVADGYQVKSHARGSVPPAGYGYGVPVDLDDSDPVFDDLEYYRPAAFRRRAG